MTALRDRIKASWASAVAILVLIGVPFYLFLPALFLGKMIYGYDMIAMGVALWGAVQHALAAHELPLWLPGLFGGMPGIASCNLVFLYPTDLVASFLRLDLATLQPWNAAIHVAWSGIGMFLFLRRLERSRSAAFFGALFFAVSGSQVSQLYGGYMIFVEGIAWTPWAFWAAHKGHKEGSWAAWGLCGLAFAMQILSLSIQLWVYTAVAVLAFVAGLARQDSQARPDAAGPWRPVLLGAGVALGVAFLISAPQLWPALQYLGQTARHSMSEAWVTAGSIRITEALTWWVPGLYGWTGALDQSFTTEYLGLLPWALAGAALASSWRREPILRWMLGMALICLFFAQRHWTPYYHLFRHIPGLSGFRIWSRTLFLVAFAVSTAASFGWDALRTSALKAPALRGAGALLVAVMLVAALIWGLGGGWADTEMDKATPSAQWALLSVPLIGALLWMLVRHPRSILLWAALGLYHMQDQGMVFRRFIRFISPAEALQPLHFSLRPPPPAGVEPWRVLDLDVYYSNAPMEYGYDNLGGQGSVPMAASVGIHEAMARRMGEWCSLMNARYIFTHDHARGDAVAVHENLSVYPRAWLVTRSRPVKDDAEAYAWLKDPGSDPRTEARVQGGPILDGAKSRGSVRWVARTPLSSALEAWTDQASLLMLSNYWYPSWRCRVDGRPVPVLKADGGLQAVLLQPGTHAVQFSFDTGFFYAAVAACAAGLLVLLGLLFWRPRMSRSPRLALEKHP